MSRRSLGGGGVGPCSPPSLCPWLTPTCISMSPSGSITLVSSPREISHYLHLKPSTWGNQRGREAINCKEAFEVLKKALITAPIVQSPDWNLPFVIMCDASDLFVEDVLGQRVDKKL